MAAEVYKTENRTLAVGDRLQFRHPDNRRNIANGEFAAVTAIGAGEATLRLQDKHNRELTLPLSAMRHVDYGYTVASFSSQGSTVDRVIVNDDSMRSSRLVNREQLYVSISRGRIDARVYTNDTEALRLGVTRDPKKEVALDAVKQRPTLALKPPGSTPISNLSSRRTNLSEYGFEIVRPPLPQWRHHSQMARLPFRAGRTQTSVPGTQILGAQG